MSRDRLRLNHFFALDVETANRRPSSICQVGLVEYLDGREVEADCWTIDPEDVFEAFHMALHGITPNHVVGAPVFGDLAAVLFPMLAGAHIVSHSRFDQVAFAQASARAGVDKIAGTWIDSTLMARSAWPDLERYDLKSVASHLGIEFRHHDALEDARVVGSIVLHAIESSGRELLWLGARRDG